MSLDDLNPEVVRVETAYREARNLWGRRLRFIPAPVVRSYVGETIRGERVTSALIGRLFFWPVYPLGFDPGPDTWYVEVECPGCRAKAPRIQMSLDHVRPISRKGLEFDRANVRWLCFTCNVRRGNRILVRADGRPENHPPLERWV